MDPNNHGVFDFLHRDPKTYAPVSSATRSDTDPPLTVPLPGGKQIEFPPSVAPVRQGTPFWDVLAEQGIRADVYKIPAAFPIQKSRQFTLSDMGTPDLQGGIDGVYTYYTTDVPDNVDRIKGWPEATFAKSRPLASPRFIPLNRSLNWRRAKSYAHAREISPSSEPVR